MVGLPAALLLLVLPCCQPISCWPTTRACLPSPRVLVIPPVCARARGRATTHLRMRFLRHLSPGVGRGREGGVSKGKQGDGPAQGRAASWNARILNDDECEGRGDVPAGGGGLSDPRRNASESAASAGKKNKTSIGRARTGPDQHATAPRVVLPPARHVYTPGRAGRGLFARCTYRSGSRAAVAAGSNSRGILCQVIVPPTESRLNGAATGPSRISSSASVNDMRGMIHTRTGIRSEICSVGEDEGAGAEAQSQRHGERRVGATRRDAR